jgi:hypothetical protein
MKAARKAIDMVTLFLSDWRQILHFAVPAPAGMHCSLKYSTVCLINTSKY